MAKPTPPPTPPAQPPSVWFLCRQCDWYCEFASHHPNPVVCPRCGSNDSVDTANEFSLTLQCIIRQQRITVNLHSEVQNMPASKASVEALEEVVVTEEKFCPVCKQGMGVGEMAKRMPCKHLFHVKCISDWLEHYGHSCPVCRFKLPKDGKAAMRGRRDLGPGATVAWRGGRKISSRFQEFI
ncbi:hypothetical protein QJS04_geneDACA009612 [Acorus gramineus]|uniref:RING-type domain-containing protein n=1 Tax=Acorus gramineus TaxID=55184 RepID=A0AAV9BDN0_ACOGR|nr:hypothetical protein QJS04_geneDACA009612 [Acorus gramineus]